MPLTLPLHSHLARESGAAQLWLGCLPLNPKTCCVSSQIALRMAVAPGWLSIASDLWGTVFAPTYFSVKTRTFKEPLFITKLIYSNWKHAQWSNIHVYMRSHTQTRTTHKMHICMHTKNHTQREHTLCLQVQPCIPWLRDVKETLWDRHWRFQWGDVWHLGPRLVAFWGLGGLAEGSISLGQALRL